PLPSGDVSKRPRRMDHLRGGLEIRSLIWRRRLKAALCTPKGVVVTETADDPAMVAVIKEHARGINGFVHEGMPARMRGMMQKYNPTGCVWRAVVERRNPVVVARSDEGPFTIR